MKRKILRGDVYFLWKLASIELMDREKCIALQWWLMTLTCLDLIKPLRYLSNPCKSIFQCCWHTPQGDSYSFKTFELYYLQIKLCLKRAENCAQKKKQVNQFVNLLLRVLYHPLLTADIACCPFSLWSRTFTFDKCNLCQVPLELPCMVLLSSTNPVRDWHSNRTGGFCNLTVLKWINELDNNKVCWDGCKGVCW